MSDKKPLLGRQEAAKLVADKMTSEGFNITHGLVDEVLQAFGKVAAHEIHKGQSVKIDGLGALHPVKKAAREVRSIQTGKMLKVPAKRGVKFSVSKNLKNHLV